MKKKLFSKNISFFAMFHLLCFSVVFGQSAGFNSTYIVLNVNGGGNSYYDLQASSINPDFEGLNLGAFCQGSSGIVFVGAEHNNYKCGGCDITGTNIYYSVYPTGSPTGNFVGNSIGWAADFNNGCGGKDQKWASTGYAANLTASLAPGNYTIEVYSDQNTSCSGTQYASNGGLNYKATFTINANITYYVDNDGDGFGNSSLSQSSCTGVPMGYVANSLDTNDNIVTYTDADADGFGSNVKAPSGVTNNLDCNDSQIQYVDNDGDGFGQNTVAACGVANNSDCNDNQLQYQDLDGDGFGNPLVLVACGQANNLDSNDNLLTYVDNDNDGFGQNTFASNGPTNNSDCNDNQLQYQDLDADGFGSNVLVACGVANNSDCNDNQLQYVDNDGDGFGQNVYSACGVTNNSDCNDNQLQYQDLDGDGFGNPLVLVACGQANNLDSNDNLLTYVDNDGDGFGQNTFASNGPTNNSDCNDNQLQYQDLDGDGFGNPLVLVACGQANNLDSNDNLLTYVDNDNDGFGQNTFASNGPTNNSDCNDNQLQYQDLDGDGFGNPLVLVACGQANNLDSNDNLLTYVDNDNDGFGQNTYAPSGPTNYLDCNDNLVMYQDLDGDGLGSNIKVPCGGVYNSTDCNDNDYYNLTGTTTFYADADGDGYGNPSNSILACLAPAGYVADNTDCNDSVAAINPGMSEILYDGFDNNCNGLLDEGYQLTAAMTNCGTTLPTLGSLISCVSTAGVDGYRFEVTNTATNAVQTIDRPLQYFSLTQLTNFDYATTYSIRVMLRKNGIWLGYYGTSCLYSTPPVTQPAGGSGTTQLQTYCGETLPTISTLISTTSLAGATGYKFRITNTTDGSIQTLTRTLHWFSLTMLPAYSYGTTYVVDVAVKTTGDYSDYGAPCNVTTPAVPTLVNYCGGATVPAKGTYIYTSSLAKVTSYRYEITRYTDNTYTTSIDATQLDRSTNWFTFNMVVNYAPNAYYGVRVQVMTAGVWSPLSDVCEIVSPATARTTEVASNDIFTVKGYPNPYDYEFNLQMESNSAAKVSIKVYDMVGKLIENQEVQPMDVPTVSIGSRYPSGVYNVVVSQGTHTQTLRMVRR